MATTYRIMKKWKTVVDVVDDKVIQTSAPEYYIEYKNFWTLWFWYRVNQFITYINLDAAKAALQRITKEKHTKEEVHTNEEFRIKL